MPADSVPKLNEVKPDSLPSTPIHEHSHGTGHTHSHDQDEGPAPKRPPIQVPEPSNNGQGGSAVP
jgi:hypothetical protein